MRVNGLTFFTRSDLALNSDYISSNICWVIRLKTEAREWFFIAIEVAHGKSKDVVVVCEGCSVLRDRINLVENVVDVAAKKPWDKCVSSQI